MKLVDLHSGEASPEEALQIQLKLRNKMSSNNGFDKIERIASILPEPLRKAHLLINRLKKEFNYEKN